MARPWRPPGEGEFDTDTPRTGRGMGAGEACLAPTLCGLGSLFDPLDDLHDAVRVGPDIDHPYP